MRLIYILIKTLVKFALKNVDFDPFLSRDNRLKVMNTPSVNKQLEWKKNLKNYRLYPKGIQANILTVSSLLI